MAAEESREARYRFAGLLVPLLAVGCGVIGVLVLLGLLELGFELVFNRPLLSGILG